MKHKLALIAAALAVVLGLTAIASAQERPTGPTPDPFCTVDCGGGEPAKPGEPFFPPPFPEGCMHNCDGTEIPEPECQINCGDSAKIPDPDCQINCDSSSNKPGKPGKPKGSQTASVQDACGDKLGHLRRVTVAQIESVGTDELVDIVPVCRSKTLAAEQDDVAQLRPVIGRNAVLDRELDQEGYNPEDVVGVIVDGRQVILYVHRS